MVPLSARRFAADRAVAVVSAATIASVFRFVACELSVRLRRSTLVDKRSPVTRRKRESTVRQGSLRADSRADVPLNLVLVVSLLLATGSVAYAVAISSQGDQTSDLYLLTEDDDGDLVADGYPEEFVRSENQSVVVGVENQEHETVEYTVIVQLQRVEVVDDETRVRERQRIGRLETTLAHNETWHREHTIAPEMTGERLRLQYLLYRGEPPAEPTEENAYRTGHLWIDVTTPEVDRESQPAVEPADRRPGR